MNIRYLLYSTIMRIAHRYNWHYAPPIHPEGDTQLWCKWCGFRQTITRRNSESMPEKDIREGCMMYTAKNQEVIALLEKIKFQIDDDSLSIEKDNWRKIYNEIDALLLDLFSE